MSIILTLFNNDFKAFKSWFATQTLSKVFVALGFMGVFGLIATGLYYGSRFFFYTVGPMGPFGLLTADYVIRAAVLMVFCLGVGSSILSSLSLFFSPNKNYFYLLSLPVKPERIVAWLFIKLVWVNCMFLAIFLMPLCGSYYVTFGKVISGLFYLKAGFGLLTLSLLTNSLGGIIAIFIVKKIKKQRLIINMGGILIFFLMLAGIFKLIFPPRMELLTAASNEQFYKIFNSLPLVSSLVPTNWIAESLTGVQILYPLLTALTAVILIISYFILMNRNFMNEIQELAAKSIAPQFTNKDGHIEKYRLKFEKYPKYALLTMKDIAAVLRSPAEAGYGVFITILMVFFFGLFSRINITKDFSPDWIRNLIVFSYMGLVFFANTYLLRLVFPLMARESDSSWFIFSLPISKTKILKSKIITAFTLGIPWLVLALVVWWGLKFSAPYQLVLAGSSFWTISLICLIQALTGAIWPNFSEGASPERVSTSTMGITALVLTTTVMAINIYTIHRYILQSLTMASLWTIQTGFGVGLVLILFILARFSVNRYEF